jgi:hypothetical protein
MCKHANLPSGVDPVLKSNVFSVLYGGTLDTEHYKT